jgi:hypothetical protein
MFNSVFCIGLITSGRGVKVVGLVKELIAYKRGDF